MNQRDKSIVEALKMFRVMTRDQIGAIFFTHCKQPVKEANAILKRLRRDGYITCSTERRMYMYMPIPSIKKDSSKLNHYLALCDFYLECKKHDQPKRFTIEPKLGGKGMVEPDIFMIWMGAPFLVEIQRNVFSDKVMKEKMNRYEQYFYSDEWTKESWQPEGKKVFPRVWMVTDHHYSVIAPFKVIQTKSVNEFIQSVKK